MSRTPTWKISDELSSEVEPIIPTQEELRKTASQKYQRKAGAGCKRKYDDRTYFEAIVDVLRTGVIWNAIPRELFGGLGDSDGF